MSDDQTPINARAKRQPPDAFEDVSLALRDRVLWPLGDGFLGLDDAARAAVAVGAVALALALGVGGYSLVSSDGGGQAPAPAVALKSEPAPVSTPTKPAPKPTPDPTLQGAAPVFAAPKQDDSSSAEAPKADSSDAATSSSGNPATDTISSNPSATATAAPESTGATASRASVEGPPAGPAAVAVARKFADAFVVYETGGGDSAGVRKSFKATAVPQVTKALLQRPPRQPAGVKVPEAKVLNIVPAPSHDRIYPVSVSLLRVGATSELRLEMEQLKNKQWRVTNVLG
jgi:hypothetical protein